MIDPYIEELNTRLADQLSELQRENEALKADNGALRIDNANLRAEREVTRKHVKALYSVLRGADTWHNDQDRGAISAAWLKLHEWGMLGEVRVWWVDRG